ncbi:MAG TPA: TIGR01244 family sulfur transferase [Sphingomicrobium sp.]|nr:TIGR01244 family sulfur transferase [Sphingomicrobium sp.]
MIRQLDEKTTVSGQIAPEDVARLAEEHGITMIVNNRPDGEEPGQPLAADIEAAAEAAGIAYRHVPILRGMGPADVEAMQDALAAAEGKTLAFCRTGNRSALVWALAMRGSGVPRDEVADRVTKAGFNVAPIAHLL